MAEVRPYSKYPLIESSSSDEETCERGKSKRGELFARRKQYAIKSTAQTQSQTQLQLELENHNDSDSDRQRHTNNITATRNEFNNRNDAAVTDVSSSDIQVNISSSSNNNDQHSNATASNASDANNTSISSNITNNNRFPLPVDDEWCRCGNCIRMPTNIECKCCLDESLCKTYFQSQDLTAGFKPGEECILKSYLLTKEVLGKVALQLQWFDQRRRLGFAGNDLLFELMDNTSYRYHAYKSYVNFVHGYLGRANRRVIPACVVAFIRTQWPDPNGSYIGYRAGEANEDSDELADIL